MELSIIIPAFNEGKNVTALIKHVHQVTGELTKHYEIIVVDGGSKDETKTYAKKEGARVITQTKRGFGNAILEGFGIAKGKYYITIDADLSHDPRTIRKLWSKRVESDIVIASRYVKGGGASMSLSRRFLSLALNSVFATLLTVPYKDLSSNYRLYRREVFEELKPRGRDFNILPEIIVMAHARGWKIQEIPFYYKPRHTGKSKAQLLKFAVSYLRTFRKLWTLRNSVESVDYDNRAYNSIIPLQRYWQRKRYKTVMRLLKNQANILDIGCGSSKIIQHLPNAVAYDYSYYKLRYLKATNNKRIRGTIEKLPFKSKSFDTVVCSQVIEHVPFDNTIFSEMNRVLKPGGHLILGTPDYDKLTWRVIERIYGIVLSNAYEDEHITHYTKKWLASLLNKHSFKLLNSYYVVNSELILFCRKTR